MIKKFINFILMLVFLVLIACGVWYLCDKDSFKTTWDKITNKTEQKQEESKDTIEQTTFILDDKTFKTVDNSQSPETNEKCSYSFLLNYSDYGVNSLEELFNENINSYFLEFKENKNIGSIKSSYCSTKQYYSNSKNNTYYIFYFKSNSGLTNDDMSILFCPIDDNTLSFLVYVNVYDTNSKYFTEHTNNQILGDLTFQSRFFGDLEFTLNTENHLLTK